MKVYLFELKRAKSLINVLIYLHLMISKSYYAFQKKKNNCTYFAEPVSYINIYTVHISYMRSFIILYIVFWLISFAPVVPLGDFNGFPKTFIGHVSPEQQWIQHKPELYRYGYIFFYM